MTVQKQGTDTTTSYQSTTTYSFSFSHTLVAAGASRVIIVAVGAETSDSVNNPAWDATSITYGGVQMARLVKSVTTENGANLNNNSSSLWILKEANLPASGTNTIVVTGTTKAGAEIYAFASAAQYAAVDQFITASTTGSSVNSPAPSSTITSAVDPNNADLIISSYICGNAGSWTVGQGQVEIFDAVNATGPTTTFGACELTFATPGPYTISSTYSATANRLTRVSASLAAKRLMNSTQAISAINGVPRKTMGKLNGVI